MSIVLRLMLRGIYEREIFRISGASLHKKFVSPTIERIEAFGIIDIINEYTAVCPSVKCYAQ